MGKKKGKYEGKRKPDKRWLWWLLVIPVYVAVTLLAEHPSLQIIWKIILSGAALFFSYFWKKDQPIMAKVILLSVACMPWLTTLGVTQRHLLLVETVLMYVAIVTLLYWNIKEHCSHETVLMAAIFLMVSVVITFSRYTYVDDSVQMRHWPVYLACGILAAVVLGVLLAKGFISLEDDRASENIAACIIAGLLGFVIPLTTVNNINYMLDTSEPTVYELTIGEKETESSSKGGRRYYLIVGRNGQQLEMRVSQSEYYQYEVGDKLPVALYEGALGDAYYIVE